MLPTHGIPPYISSLRMRYHAAAAAQAFSSVLRTRPSQGSLTAATTLRMLQGNAGGGGASFLMPLVFDGIVNAGATPFQVRQACVQIRSSVYKAQQFFASGCSCTQPDSVYAHASMSHIQPPYRGLNQRQMHFVLLAGLACIGCSIGTPGTSGTQLVQLGSSLSCWWGSLL
jgi:hypothetical protein